MDVDVSAHSLADYFLHIRIITGMFVSLCMSRVLLALAQYIQFPKKYKPNYLHIVWLLTFSLLIIDWWWDIFETSDSYIFSYPVYLVFILYAFNFYFLSALITPGELPDHENFDEYFMGVKGWFYALSIMSMLVTDMQEYFSKDGESHIEYELIVTVIVAFIYAMVGRSKSFRAQRVIATIVLVLQILLVALQIVSSR